MTGKKLEIGPGSKPKAGYVHFDIRPLPNVDVVGDARNLPFADGEFVEVFSRYFLEHLPRADARLVLLQMYRVLQKEGVLEIIVPNLAYFCKLFITETGQKKEWALNKLYGFENYVEDHHYFGYDEQTLTNELTKAGFTSITRVAEEEQYLHLRALKP